MLRPPRLGIDCPVREYNLFAATNVPDDSDPFRAYSELLLTREEIVELARAFASAVGLCVVGPSNST